MQLKKTWRLVYWLIWVPKLNKVTLCTKPEVSQGHTDTHKVFKDVAKTA